MSYAFLIIEDSATLRASIKRTIRLAGLGGRAIHEASSAEEALDVLANHHVDLILADMDMREDDDDEEGESAEERIGRILSEPDTRAVPVVLLTSSPDVRELARLRRAGARGHLRKPLTPEALRDMVSRVLEPTHA